MITKERSSAPPMMSWQYRNMIAELGQVTLHSSDDSCPCNQVHLGDGGKHHAEYCIGKHLLNFWSLCLETALMDPTHRSMLETMASEALEFHEKAKTIYCKGGTWPDLPQWSRDTRKKLEPIYFACDIKLKAAHLHTEFPVCTAKGPVFPICAASLQAPVSSAVSITGKCGASIDTCMFTIKRKGKSHVVTKKVETAKVTTCKATSVKDLVKQSKELLTEHKCSIRPIGSLSANLHQDPTVKISGTCTTTGCNLKVKGAVETLQATDASGLKDAINTVIHHFDKRETSKPSTRTFAPGISTTNRYEFEFKVVEASDLIVSHDPFTFAINPKYTAKIQPRIRERLANQLQVKKIAARLDPEKLLLDTKAIDTGSPIVGPDNIVECGNGRVMALVMAGKEHPANIVLYRQALKEAALNYGLPVAPIDKMRLPVLVRVRLTPVDRQAFAEECNARPTIETSAIEKARTDADKITPAMLQSLDVLEGEPIERALRSERNKPFVSTYLSKVPENEQAGLVDSRGYLSSDGIRRMVMGIFTATFKGDIGIKLAEKFFEAIDETGVKNAFNGILKSLGIMAQAENLVAGGQREPSLTIGEDLAKTMTVFSNLRGADMPVEKYLAQYQMLERQLTPFQEAVLKVLDEHTRSAKRIGSILTYYAQAVIDSTPPGQAQMIPGPKPDKTALFTTAVKRVVAEVEAERIEREARKKREPAAASMSQDYSWLIKKLECPLSPTDINQALGWRPLRDFLAWATGLGKKVELCSAGMVQGAYQVIIYGVDELNIKSQAAKRAQSIPNMTKLWTPYRELVYTVVLPESQAKELTWTPQDVFKMPTRREPMAQAAMFAGQGKAGVCQSLNSALADESKAGDEYRALAFAAKSEKMPDVARTLNGIARVEDTHYTKIGGLVIKNCGDSSKASLHDPLLAQIATQICTTGACFAAPAKFPVCRGARAEKLESCILKGKARNIEAGCVPEGTGSKKCPNVFAVCTTSLKCHAKAGANA